jgi:hypothetical protein
VGFSWWRAGGKPFLVVCEINKESPIPLIFDQRAKNRLDPNSLHISCFFGILFWHASSPLEQQKTLPLAVSRKKQQKWRQCPGERKSRVSLTVVTVPGENRSPL